MHTRTIAASVAAVVVLAGCAGDGADPESAEPSSEFDPGRRPCYDIDYAPVIEVLPFTIADLTVLPDDTENSWTCSLVPRTERVGGQDAQLVVGIILEQDTEQATQVYQGLRDSRGGLRELPPEDLAGGWDHGGTWRRASGDPGEQLATATVGLQLQDGALLLVMTFGLSGFADPDAQAAALLELAENARTSMRGG